MIGSFIIDYRFGRADLPRAGGEALCLVQFLRNTSQKTPSSPDPRPPKTSRNRYNLLSGYTRAPVPSRYRVDRTPQIAASLNLRGPAEQTAWLHSAFPWHVPREDRGIPPLETKYPMNHHSASTPVLCLPFRPCPRRPPERTSASRTAAAPNASVVSTPAMHPLSWKSGPATAKKSSAAPSRSCAIAMTQRQLPRTPSSARTDGLAIFWSYPSLATSVLIASQAPA